jgi:hypothetical protein
MIFLPRGNSDGWVFRLRAPYSPAFPSWFVHDSGCLRFSFPSRLRGSGGFLPLFLTSIFKFVQYWRSIIKRFPSCQEQNKQLNQTVEMNPPRSHPPSKKILFSWHQQNFFQVFFPITSTNHPRDLKPVESAFLASIIARPGFSDT